MDVFLHQAVQTIEIPRHTRFGERERESRSDVRDTRRVRLNPRGEVSGYAIVAQASEPSEAFAVELHDALVFPPVALPVFPRSEPRHTIAQTGYHLGSEHRPITAV